ncbi:MAG: trigger factor [Bacteroidales bacterium]
MHIEKEETGNLTATIKITVGREDYDEKVNKTLKDYQRKATMPGFRPGKVPFGMISKMYRKGVLLDEINHLISHKLQDYVEENQLRLIGNPLPDTERSANIDLDNQSEFDFFFNIGIAPECAPEVSDKTSVDYFKIKATDKMVDEYVTDLRKRYHKHMTEQANAEKAVDEEAEGSDAKDHELAEKELDIDDLPEMNEEFFKQVFPGEEISDEAAFREKVRESIETSLVKESERYFLNDAIEKLVENTPVELPGDFIRKLLIQNNEEEKSEEELEKQLENFSRSIKWQLIESRIVKEYDLTVKEEEMRNVVKAYFTGHMAGQEESPEHTERLDQIVNSVLSNKEESSRLHDQLFEKKLLDLFRDKLKLEHKDIPYDEFVNLVTQKRA